MKFNPSDNSVTLAGELSVSICAVFADLHCKSYVIDSENLTAFDPSTGLVEVLDVKSWQPLYGAALVYVTKLDRIYILGAEIGRASCRERV